MNWTIPMMYLCLLLLFMERIDEHLGRKTIMATILSNPYATHIVLVCIWSIIIAIAFAYSLIQSRIGFVFNQRGYQQTDRSISSEISSIMNISKTECHIDGRLSPALKIMLIVVLIFLVIQGVPSIISCVSSAVFRTVCCLSRTSESDNFHWKTSFIFVSIILLNIFCSFPFYFVSSFTLITTLFQFNNETFQNTLRITFVLRIISIIVQCLVIIIVDIQRFCTFLQTATVKSSHLNTDEIDTRRTKNRTKKKIKSDIGRSSKPKPIAQNSKSDSSIEEERLETTQVNRSTRQENTTKHSRHQSLEVQTEVDDIVSSPAYKKNSKQQLASKSIEYQHKQSQRGSNKRQLGVTEESFYTEKNRNFASKRSFPNKITEISTAESSSDDRDSSSEMNTSRLKNSDSAPKFVSQSLPLAKAKAITPVMRTNSTRTPATVASSSRNRYSMRNEKEEDKQLEKLIKRISTAV